MTIAVTRPTPLFAARITRVDVTGSLDDATPAKIHVAVAGSAWIPAMSTSPTSSPHRSSGGKDSLIGST